jgi:integrase-like protein
MPKLRSSPEIERRYLERFERIVEDYEQIKMNSHSFYKSCTDLFKAQGMNRQVFNKYYQRYLASGREIDSLKPLKRGPRYGIRRRDIAVESRLLELRNIGNNRYEIAHLLKSEFGPLSLSASTVYNRFCEKGLNRLKPVMKQERKRYVKERAGELGHIDCHYLGAHLIAGEQKKRYLIALMDDATRIVYGEVIENLKSLTVMFATMRLIRVFMEHYGIRFEAILSDNGPEFGKKGSKNKESHPFERMLMELGIKHVYTPPYRPQVNGKIERFWKTIHDDLIDADYDSIEEFKEQLLQYYCYYNHERPHQGLGHKTPAHCLENLKQLETLT